MNFIKSNFFRVVFFFTLPFAIIFNILWAFIMIPLNLVVWFIKTVRDIPEEASTSPFKTANTTSQKVLAHLGDFVLTARTAAIGLLLVGVTIIFFGFYALYPSGDEEHTFRQFVSDFYANGGAELLSIAITVLVIETLSERRSNRIEKQRLIAEMGSLDATTTRNAVRQLRANGWLYDGSLNSADLNEANLDGTDLRNANIERANLQSAKLNHSRLDNACIRDSNFAHAELNKANLTNTDLQNANFCEAKMTSTILSEADLLGANFQNVQLDHAYLTGCNLIKANFDGANLGHADLREANLSNATLIGAQLIRIKMEKSIIRDAKLDYTTTIQVADFTEADLTNSTLDGIQLSQNNFAKSICEQVSFTCCNLTEVNFDGANLRYANLAEANLYGANLLGADLTGANLDDALLSRAKFDETTTLPNGRPWMPGTDFKEFNALYIKVIYGGRIEDDVLDYRFENGYRRRWRCGDGWLDEASRR